MTNQLMHHFDVSASYIGFLGAAFYLPYALMQSVSGWLIDKYGARKALTISALLMSIALLSFACAQYFYLLLLSRVLMGCSASTAFIASYYLASRHLPHQYFSLFAAVLHMFGSLGAILAQKPLASLVNNYGWRVPLLFCALVLFFLSCLYGIFIRNGRTPVKKQQSSQQPNYLASLRYTLIHPQVKWIAICGFLGWLPLSIIGALWGVPYFMMVYHWTNFEAANATTFFWLGSAVGAIILSWVSETMVSRKKPFLICFAGTLIMSIFIIEAPLFPPYVIYFSLFVLGICVCLQTLSFSLIKETVPPTFFACAAGINNMGAMFSSAIGQNLVGLILDFNHPASGFYTIKQYQTAFLILPFASLIGLIVCYVKVKETYCQITHGEVHEFSQT